MNRTLVLLKPDAVERGLVGEIISRFERKGLRIVAARLLLIDNEQAEAHYEEHRDKPFFSDIVKFITTSPVLAMVLEGPTDAWKVVRSIMGATDPSVAVPGTIRGDLASSLPDNLVHGSDGPEAAKREIALFFPDLA